MTIQGAKTGIPCSSPSQNCPDLLGCDGKCPDFQIKRHDTKPPMKVLIEDCEGPLDLTEDNLVVEASMWAKAKLKKDITNSDTYFALASNVGFDQIMVGDIIIMDRVRRPEHMLVTAFDEVNYFVQVQRGYNATPITAWKKGTVMRIFRFIDAPGQIELVTDNVLQVDGTTLENQLIEAFLVFEWDHNNTCLPGCYWMEYKLLKMVAENATIQSMNLTTPSVTPSFTPSTLSPSDFGCNIGEGVEWIRRFPNDGEGFLINIINTPTTEII